jgi:hypothetical protein
MSRRLPQYARHVLAQSSSQYRYRPGADPQRFIDMLRTGRARADDEAFAANETEEDGVIAKMEAAAWTELALSPADHTQDEQQLQRVQRRWLLRPVDFVRDKMPVGDR